ncbi:MAG: hypothetical protein ACK4RM_11090 [Flavobacterium sp.]
MENPRFIFLPAYSKYIGFLVILISIIIAVVHLLSGISVAEFFNPNADIKIIAVYAMLILGSVLTAFSKESVEDEFINHLRMKSFLFSIVLHSIFFFVFSFSNITIFLINFPAIILMDSILLVYIVSFYFYKFRVRQDL